MELSVKLIPAAVDILLLPLEILTFQRRR